MRKFKLIQQEGHILFACDADIGIDWFIEKCKTELPGLDTSSIIQLYNGYRQIIEEEVVTCKTIKVETI